MSQKRKLHDTPDGQEGAHVRDIGLWRRAVMLEADPDKRKLVYDRLLHDTPVSEAAKEREIALDFLRVWDRQETLAFNERIDVVYLEFVSRGLTRDDVLRAASNIEAYEHDWIRPAQGRFVRETGAVFNEKGLQPWYLYHITYFCTLDESPRRPQWFKTVTSYPHSYYRPEAVADEVLGKECIDIGHCETVPMDRIRTLIAECRARGCAERDDRQFTVSWFTIVDRFKNATSHYFLCGPPGHVFGVTSLVYGGIDTVHIRFDLFAIEDVMVKPITLSDILGMINDIKLARQQS